MKNKNLIIVNTYFQLITAINLALNNLKDCDNDLVLTDITVGAKNKIEKLKKMKIFDNIYFIEYKKLNSTNKFKKNLVYLLKRSVIIKNYFSTAYDKLFFYNYDILTYSIFDELNKKNKKLRCARFDEGIGTYTIDASKFKGKILRLIFLKKNINKSIDDIYLYHPELLCYKNDKKLVKIPILSKNDTILKNILNELFDYKKEHFSQKYIFFEEAFFNDKKDIDDYELILKIAEVVGKDNLIIKLHPRNKINRFSELGIPTWKNSEIPWEVIQLNENYQDKIFLSISSGAILMSKLFFKEQVKSYYLFNCTNHMSYLVTDNFHNYLNKIDETIGLNNIIIPNNKEDFIKKLNSEKGDLKK